MKEILDTLYLEKIDLRNYVVDLDRFNIINMSQYQADDILYLNKYKYYRGIDYVKKKLKSGYAIYYDGIVYYVNFLDANYFNKSKIEELKSYINKIVTKRKEKNYFFSEYLLEERFYIFVENYIRMYNKGIVKIEWVRKKLEDKVSDVEIVIKNDFLGTV